MNHTIVKSSQEVADIIHELTATHRPIRYHLSDILVVKTERGYEIFYQK